MDKNTNLGQIICKIYYAKSINIDSIRKNADQFKRSVNFVPGEDWEEIYFAPGTAKFDEKSKRTKAGIIYNQELSFNFPGNDQANESLVDEMMNYGQIFKIDFNNSTSKIIGDLDNPVKTDQDYTLNNKSHGFDFSFKHESSHRAYWFETESGGGQIPD